jgi:ribonuclease P protein component
MQRITSADDYKRVVRRGRRSVGANCVSYFLMNPNGGTPRFGFIVAKTVGNAVVRNRVRRRLKAIALPSAAVARFSDLKSEIMLSTAKLVARS